MACKSKVNAEGMGLRVGVVVVAVDMVAIVGAPLGAGAGAGAEEGMMRARVDVVADLYKVVGVVDSMVPERQLLIQFCAVTRAYIHELPRSMGIVCLSATLFVFLVLDQYQWCLSCLYVLHQFVLYQECCHGHTELQYGHLPRIYSVSPIS